MEFSLGNRLVAIENKVMLEDCIAFLGSAYMCDEPLQKASLSSIPLLFPI